MSTIRPGQSLNDFMEFDHVIQVHPDGRITDDVHGIYAPDLIDEELSGDDRWEFFSNGYTGQHGAGNSPIMHNSESIGAGIERDIRRTPGLYCTVVATWSPDEDDDPEMIEADGWPVEGWAVVRMDVVSLVKAPRIYIAGTRVIFAEDGSGPETEENGWIDPNWSRSDILDDMPHRSADNGYDRDDYFPDEPNAERAHWIAEQIHQLVGYIDSVNGEVFYGTGGDSWGDPTDPAAYSVQAIVKHSTEFELARVIEILEAKQPGYRIH